MSLLSVSDHFLQVAAAAGVASYKHLAMEVTFELPDSPGIVSSYAWSTYDRLDIGLEPIILIRAALENPELAPLLLKDLEQGSHDVIPGQLAHIRDKIEQIFHGVDNGDAASQQALEQMKRKTETELDRRLNFANLDFSCKLDFTQGNDQKNIALMKADARTRYLGKVMGLVTHWQNSVEGRLHCIHLSTASIPNQEELNAAMQSCSPRGSILQNVEYRGNKVQLN